MRSVNTSRALEATPPSLACEREFAATLEMSREGLSRRDPTACNLRFPAARDREKHLFSSSSHPNYYNLGSPEPEEDHSDVHYPCRQCDECFGAPEIRQEHEYERHLWCSAHDRTFQAPANLRAHLNSAQHLGLKVDCPAGCKHRFADRSAAIFTSIGTPVRAV